MMMMMKMKLIDSIDYTPCPTDIEQYNKNGFIIIRNFLSQDQAQQIRAIAASDEIMAKNAYEKEDSYGLKSRVTLWYEPGEDVFGRLSCSDRLLQEMTAFLGGRAELFHAKLMQK